MAGYSCELLRYSGAAARASAGRCFSGDEGTQNSHYERGAQRADGIGGEIVPAGVAPGQNALVQFVDSADDEGRRQGEKHRMPGVDADADADGDAKGSESNHMGELVPW